MNGVTQRLPAGVTDSSGTLTTPVNNQVFGSPATQILAGSTWDFQAIYRDPAAGAGIFNLTGGLEILFTP
ncbi:MAG: hypothetical protein GY711_34050 [bacterium]|nr:hypothetical protein [bacterium]